MTQISKYYDKFEFQLFFILFLNKLKKDTRLVNISKIQLKKCFRKKIIYFKYKLFFIFENKIIHLIFGRDIIKIRDINKK